MIKNLFICLGLLLILGGCKSQTNTASQTPKLEEVIVKLQNGEKNINAPQTLLDDAQILLDRSYLFGYKLIDAKALLQLMKDKQIILIDTSMKGKYLLEHIDGAKHFEFDQTFISPEGELIWNSQKGKQNNFAKKLGSNFFSTLVFYDQDQTPAYQASPSEIASMWAKKMGYHNVYRLIGQMPSWKSQGFVTTNETPKCCQ